MTPPRPTDSEGASTRAGGASGDGTTHALFVLGMHRSGTSAVTRVINLLGVPLSIRADWWPDTPQVNPTGFWESQSLSQMNDQLLAAFDGTWQIPPPLEGDWPADSRLDALRTAAPRVVDEVFPTQKWVWKDPRNCLTLPFWLEALDVTPTIVLIHRSPVEVALSILWRDALPISHSLALWERYLRASIHAATGRPTYVLDYRQLIEDPTASTDDLRRFLESVGFEVLELDAAGVQSFVSSELRHSSFPNPETWAQFGVSPEQLALHETLVSAAGPHDALDISDSVPETFATEVRFQRLRLERNAASTLESTTRMLHEAREAILGLQDEQRELVSSAALDPAFEAGATELAALATELASLRFRVDAVERSKALRLLTAPGRLRRRIGTGIRSRLGEQDDAAH